jgi:membrane-associated protease RseP (regulator of RpoE activity)
MFSVNLIKYFELLAISAGYLPSHATDNPIVTVDFVPAIPGVSIGFETLPYFFIAITIAAALHELAHGVASRAENIKLKSTGIMFFLFFFGAFVEPDEKSLQKASTRSKLRVYAAGAFTNVVLVLILIVLLTPLFFNLIIGSGFNPNPEGALVLETCPNSLTDCAVNNLIFPEDVITSAQYENGTSILIKNSANFSLFASQTKSNEQVKISLLRSPTDPVTVVTTPHPLNSSHGLLGVIVTNYYQPNFSFLPLQFPYWYLRILSITISLSLVLALINLLPVPPLDGDKIATELIKYFKPNNFRPYLKWVRIITLFIVLGNLLLTFIVKGWNPI